jgi:hypothetical protein
VLPGLPHRYYKSTVEKKRKESAGGLLSTVGNNSSAYQRWGKDTLGFGLYLFRTPS